MLIIFILINLQLSADAKDNSIGQVEKKFIDLNTADVATLIKLPGIGLNKAKSIIDYREENGNFLEIKALLKVKGMNQNILNQIKQRLIVQTR